MKTVAASVPAIVAAIPQLLGVVVTDSVVLMGFQSGTFRASARLDADGASVEDLVGALKVMALNGGVDSVLCVGYPSISIPDVVAAIAHAGVSLIDCGEVVNGVFISYTGESSRLAEHPSTSARLALDGVAAYESEEAFAESLAYAEVEGLGEALEALTGHVPDGQEAARVWRELLDPDAEGVDVGALALALVALRELNVRDALLSAMAPGILPAHMLPEGLRDLSVPVLDAPDRRLRIEALHKVCSLAPPSERAAVLTLTGHVHWANGDGLLARVSIEQALKAGPGYRLAELLMNLLALGARFTPSTGGAA